MQGDRGLAGAGAAADERGPGRRGSDRFVLLALDGGDDVAHPGAGRARQRGHQRTVADDPHVGRRGIRVEEIVLDAGHPLAVARDRSATDHLHRIGRRGTVERRGGRCPPVDDERPSFVVAKAEPADVSGLRTVQIEPAEHEALVLRVEHPAPPGGMEDHRVAFDQRTEVSDAREAVAGRLGRGRVLFRALQARVDAIDVPLFRGDLGGRVATGVSVNRFVLRRRCGGSDPRCWRLFVARGGHESPRAWTSGRSRPFGGRSTIRCPAAGRWRRGSPPASAGSNSPSPTGPSPNRHLRCAHAGVDDLRRQWLHR